MTRWSTQCLIYWSLRADSHPSRLTLGDGALADPRELVHPALHNKNLSPVILGPAIELSSRHAKVRREGYRLQ